MIRNLPEHDFNKYVKEPNPKSIYMTYVGKEVENGRIKINVHTRRGGSAKSYYVGKKTKEKKDGNPVYNLYETPTDTRKVGIYWQDNVRRTKNYRTDITHALPTILLKLDFVKIDTYYRKWTGKFVPNKIYRNNMMWNGYRGDGFGQIMNKFTRIE